MPIYWVALSCIRVPEKVLCDHFGKQNCGAKEECLHLVATERECAREGMKRDIPQIFVHHDGYLLFTVLIALLCPFFLGTADNLNTYYDIVQCL